VKIIFKNKEELEISQEIADVIAKAIDQGAVSFKHFTHDEHLTLFINLKEIIYIK
jgi:hypothetical protein